MDIVDIIWCLEGFNRKFMQAVESKVKAKKYGINKQVRIGRNL